MFNQTSNSLISSGCAQSSSGTIPQNKGPLPWCSNPK